MAVFSIIFRLRRLHIHVSAPGFQSHNTEIVIRTAKSVELNIRLEVAGQYTSMTVESSADNMLQTHSVPAIPSITSFITTLPTLSPDSGLNDAIIYTTPGVAADSNGFFHPLGDHAQVSYVIDGQPIGDQRNKVFSTSIPANAIQSMEVISGSPRLSMETKRVW